MVRPDLGRYKVTQRFGANAAYREKNGKLVDPFGYGATGHPGVDLGTPLDSPLYAGVGGVVTHVVNHPSGGLYVQIQGDKYSVYTGHMKTSDVRVGQKVSEGQVIGKSGATGNVTGPHTHWQVRDLSGKLVDPLALKLNEGGEMADGKIYEIVDQVQKNVEALRNKVADQGTALAKLYEIVDKDQKNLEQVRQSVDKAIQQKDDFAGIVKALEGIKEELKK